MKRILILFLLGAAAFLSASPCRGEDAVEWKENWDATYAFNRDKWEKEFKTNPRGNKRQNAELPTHMIGLLETLLKKYPDDQAHKLGAYAELADQLAKIEARGRSCEYHKKIIDESRGKPDSALAELQAILKVYPRYYETPEARQWQEYAGRRLMALYRVGHISSTNPTLMEAMECLLAVRSAQGRFLEAAQILDSLKSQNRSDERIKVQEAELYFKLGHIEKALECYQEMTYAKQDRSVPQRIALLSSHRWSSIAQQQYAFAPELDKKWRNVLEAKIEENLPSVEGLIQEDEDGKNVIGAGAQFASAWSVIDAQLRAMPEKIASLRQAHADEASALLAAARRTGRVDELMSVFRKYPWSEAGHAALLEYGERQLFAGRAELAARAFQDVLSHSNAKAAEAQARSELRLALEQDKHAAATRTAEAPRQLKKIALPLPAIFPWPHEMAEDIPPEIRPYLAWPGIEITALKDATLLSGPNLLICFGADLSSPRWVLAPNAPRGVNGQIDVTQATFFHAPAPVRPAVADGVVYTRWGLDATHCFPSHLAAVDLASGEMLWSTARDQAWRQISPIGDPVVSDQKLFAMAIENGSSRSAAPLAISLVCLDARNGAFLWQRQLASHQLTTLPQIGERERAWDWESQRGARYADMFHYGNAVTVDGGAVYCSTNCGVAARVDARDGVIEWLVSYARSTPNAAPLGYLRREGTAPMISGEHAIFLTRDYEGVFALNKETGQLEWENPFAPSQSKIALLNDALLTSDRDNVAALDPATGRAIWFRSFANGIACRPVSDGSSVIVASGGRLQRILTATGASVEETPLDKNETPAQIALRGGELLVASMQNPRDFPNAQNVTAPTKTKSAGKIEFPLKQVWSLSRANPELILPPDEAGMPGRVIVSSEGLLECVEDSPAEKIIWRRFVAPGLPEFAWDKDILLLLYARHVEARDGNSGELKWRCAIPFVPEHWLLNRRLNGAGAPFYEIAAPYLFFSETERSPQFGAIELASGKLLWTRRIDNFHRKDVPMAFDGKRLYLFGTRMGAETGVQLLNAEDGLDAGTRFFLPRDVQQPRGVWVSGTEGFFLSEGLTVHTIDLRDDKMTINFHADFREAVRRVDPHGDLNRLFSWDSHFKSASAGGRWMDIEDYLGHHAQRAIPFIFDRTNPDYLFRRRTDGVIRGDQLFDTSGGALTVIDLPSTHEIARFVIPSPAQADAIVRVADFWKDGETMYVVSGDDNAGVRNPLRINAYDAARCAHRGGQVLPDVTYWKAALRNFNDEREESVRPWRETQVCAHGATVIVTDAQGVHAFASTVDDKATESRELVVAHRQAVPLVAGGAVQEWAKIPSIAADSTAAGKPLLQNAGGLRVAHDAENLYLAAEISADRIHPRFGTGELATGDWFEVELTSDSGRLHGCVAIDARGQSFWEDAADGEALCGDIQTGVRGDLVRGTQIFEAAIPMRAIFRGDAKQGDTGTRRHEDAGTLELSVSVWTQTAMGPRKVAEWGAGSEAGTQGRGDAETDGHLTIFLDSLTTEEEQAAWRIVDLFPDLNASKTFIRKMAATRGAAELQEILRTHAHETSIKALLEAFDFRIHSAGGDALKIAEAAGVDAGVRAKFAARASAYLSQWVYMDAVHPPGMIMLQLNDGTSWEHRMSWGELEWPLVGEAGTASRRLGGSLPAAGSWQELRVPLLWVEMQDTPICGLSFGQQGGGRVSWERAALVVDGKETVLIDGAAPEGKLEGDWEWFDAPIHGKARVHANREALDDGEALAHSVLDLKKSAGGPPAPQDAGKMPAPQNARAEMLALLEREVPKLGGSDEALAFFREMQELDEKAPEKMRARLNWFLSALPRNPADAELLVELLQRLKASRMDKPEEEVEAAIKAAKLPPQTAYDYRRKFAPAAHQFVRNVQVLGPFPDPSDAGRNIVLPPEGKAADLAAKLQMGDFVLEWKALKSARDYIDLSRALKPSEHVVAFAACYVQCEKARSGMMEIGADDGCKVWINQKLVHAHRSFGVASPGGFKTRVFFNAGVNEVLIKVDNKSGDWGFFLEFVEADGRGPMQGIRVSETPP
ncbi:MAG TPA: PQQ-binding-like beta-propeller repeat protein [Planctomycetota bacterium]|nr:PQQ-binding-like beta-propeller repeat protein [Planctomycetota bacterium]